MSKKRAKSGTGSAGAGRWESGLLSTPFEEESWTCFVGVVMPSQVPDQEYADTLCSSVTAGHRKLFSLVTYKGLIEEVQELGNPKGKKPKEVPAFSEICEAAKVHLDSGEALPHALLAKLVKWKLLALKQEDLKRRETEEKSANGGDKDKKSGKKSARGKSAKGKGKKTPEVPSPKKESTLKKRGEESQENKYTDDEPDDGPQHYILLYGFMEANLLVLLSDLGVNIGCIIRLTSEDYGLFEKRKALKEEEEDVPRSQEVIDAERALEDKASKEIEGFWSQYEPLLKGAPQESSLQDVARLTYTVESDVVPKEYEDSASQAEFGEALFEDVACMIYDLLDQRRQYQNYKDNMKLIRINASHIPTAEARPASSGTAPGLEPSTTLVQPDVGQQRPHGPADVDMRYYRDLMDTIPAECCSVPLIMHCMLEQVSATEEGRDPPSAWLEQPRDDGLAHSLAAHIDSISAKFITGSKSKDDSNQRGGKEQFPVFYHHGDKTSERLRYLSNIGGFDHLAAEQAMMRLLPVSMVTKFPRPVAAVIKERSARLHELLYQCFQEGMDPAVMDHTLRMFVFESMALRSTDGDGRVQRDRPDEDVVWDDPYLNAPRRKVTSRDGQRDTLNEVSPPAEAPPSALDISRSQTPGILKSRQGSATSVRSSKSQVHFKDGVEAVRSDAEPRCDDSKVSIPDRKQSPTPSLISVRDVADKPQRTLDDWCFVEHLKPNVLLQVLDKARTLCPFIDTYYHRKDHSLLVVMHNPVGPKRRNVICWDAKLHSDVGFRNYLEHVAEYIGDWTEKEEGRYQAEVKKQEIAAELSAARLAASETSSPSGSRPGSGKGRAQSPKKSRSKSPKGRKSESPAPASNLDPNSGSFMRPNSLKAWKVEHDRELAEEERKKQEKDKKAGRKKSARSRSASPKKEEKDEKGKSDGKKRSSSGSGRGSRKGEKEKREERETKEESAALELTTPERYYPFVGYDVGNNMIHVNGSLTSLFPTEGGLVCCEKTEFINGEMSVQATVLRDGHSLTVHIINPHDDPDEGVESVQLMTAEPGTGEQDQKPTTETAQRPLSEFGSLTATLSDGMVLSFSSYGVHGAPKTKEPEVKDDIEPPLLAAPSPPPAAVSPKPGRGGSGKKGKKGALAASIAESEKQSLKGGDSNNEEESKPSQPAVPDCPEEPPYQQLFVSCPTGLHVTYMLEPTSSGPATKETDHRNLLVRQSYPSKTAGRQPCEAAILNPAMQERCRYVNSEGTVIKQMEDGTAEVLFPTGVVSRGTPSFQTEGSTLPEQSPQRTGSSASTHPGTLRGSDGRAGEPAMDGQPQEAGSSPCTMEWVTTTVTGDQVSTRSCDPPLRERAVLLYSATDPVTQEAMTTRQDKVVIVERPDGTRIVDHSDGTRITSYAVDVEYRETHIHAEETGELAPLEVRSVPHVKVECVGYATVIFNSEDSIATTVFGNGSQVIAIPDGSYEVLHHDSARMTVAEDGCVQFTPAPQAGDEASSASTVYTLHHHRRVICEVNDDRGLRFSLSWMGEVDSDANPDRTREESSEELDGGGDDSKKAEQLMNVPRYFVIHADGSGCELLRETDILDYFRQMETDPSSALIQDALPDHPEVQSITVMRPYQPRAHSENWLIRPEESNIVPPNLRPRDFASLPTSELLQPGNSKLGLRVGRGLAVGSCEDLPRPPPAPKCPQYLQLRQFTQYQRLEEGVRGGLKAALEAYARGVEEQSRVDIEQELKDPRSEEERALAGELLAQILAQDENQRDDDSGEVIVTDGQQYVQRADAPSPVPAQPLSVEDPIMSRELYESSTAPEPVTPPPMPRNKYTPQDWERAQATLDEEAANREALRRGEVPPYFQSQWGKAFLATQTARELDDPDMAELAMRLAKGTLQGTQPPSSCLPDTPEATLPLGGRDSGITPSHEAKRMSDPAPGIPLLQTPGGSVTPVVLEGDESSTNVRMKRGAASSPSGVRPTNPTPGHALGDGTPTQVRPGAPLPDMQHRLIRSKDQATPLLKAQRAGIFPVPHHPAMPPSLTTHLPYQSSLKRAMPWRTTTEHSKVMYEYSSTTAPSTISEQPEEYNAMEDNNGTFQEGNHFSDEALPVAFSSESVIEGIAQGGEDSASPLKTASSRAGRTPVRLPAAIQGQKPPGTLPNKQFQEVEEPVRRKVTTSSLAGSSGEAKVSANRGFQLFPGEVFFGELREGCTYSMIVNLKNVGIDSCRYKIKQPPPATGLQVIYKPGSVAAGMKAELKIQLYAIAVGVEGDSGRGSIGHHIEITTETDFIFLPVSAYILTADKYDEECRVNGRPYLSPGARLVSSRPPSREGIIRPRKDGVNSGNGEISLAQ